MTTISAQDWQRMSWHQRARMERQRAISAKAAAVEAESAAQAAEAIAEPARTAMRALIAELDTALRLRDAKRKPRPATPAQIAAARGNIAKATHARSAQCQALRDQAGKMFASGRQPYYVALALGISEGTAVRWRTQWRKGQAA